jgi:hypothetical protein
LDFDIHLMGYRMVSTDFRRSPFRKLQPRLSRSLSSLSIVELFRQGY